MEDMSFYWLTQAIIALPIALWVYVVVGVPYALIALPRRDWASRAEVGALAFAFGPALVTGWLFIIGTIGGATESPLLRFDIAFIGTAIIAIIGWLIAWRKRRTTSAPDTPRQPLVWDEKLIIGLIVIALILRWLVTAYWPFTAYDPLWVYGFQGRLYTLTGYIPQDIGYYPQFMSLQYAFGQLAAGGIDDRFARAVVPFLHIGSILAAYVLGHRLISRRAGIFTAAMWALYPHVSEWARIGDLEIPVAFTFTLASAYFLRAWFDTGDNRRRYAIIAGLAFGVAMWTKPTAGAFVWGVCLLVIADLLRVRFDWRAWWPRFEVAVLTGIACMPLGAVWYVRNVLLGHNAVDFPNPFWLTLATQSGDLFGWPLMALALLSIGVIITRRRLTTLALLIIAWGLILLAVLPSMPWLNPARINPPASRMTVIEWAIFAAGIVLIGAAFWRLWHRAGASTRGQAGKIAAALLIALPYFVTWFASYSYHARLSFAIVPLLILPSAALLSAGLSEQRAQNWRFIRRGVWAGMLMIVSIPGIIGVYQVAAPQPDWGWVNHYPNDLERYRVHNPGVVMTAEYISGWIEANGRNPVLIAPGEQRLHFFFPLLGIDEFNIPTALDELDGATHYLYGGQARLRYQDMGIAPADNQIVSALARKDIMAQYFRFTDATFRYELYEVNSDQRWNASPETPILDDEIIFGDVVRFVGDSVSTRQLINNTLYVNMQFQALAPMTTDYQVTLRLINRDDETVYYTWEGYIAEGEHGHYATNLWDTGEYVFDQWRRQFVDDPTIPRSQNYEILIGLKDPATGDYLPVTVNGEIIGDGYPLNSPFYVGG